MTVSFVNLKGGVAKTTSAVNIGAVLAEKGRDVLLVDMDPQGTLTGWFDRDPPVSIVELFAEEKDLKEVIQMTDYDRLDLIPARRSLVKMLGKGGRPLGNALRRLIRPAQDTYDFILVDSPPSLGSFSMAAVAAADRLLSPVQASVSAVDGLADTLQLGERFNHSPESWLGAFVTLVDLRANYDRDVLPYLRDVFPGRVFDTFIRATVRVRESHNEREPTVHYEPGCTASEDYRTLTAEILRYADEI